jgi:hypothetical protein
MNKEEEYKHRLLMIKDDLKLLIEFINDNNLSVIFRRPTKVADEARSHIYNMSIACDLKDDECLSWRWYHQEVIDDIIAKLKEISVDGESMEFILDQVGLKEQIHKQLVLTDVAGLTETFLEIRNDG